ncbi:trypsin-like peptidase domain-containing protein [Candidatus Woesearchaeota archaeon]|nr:trypsin-like peptidase domain-containing protein [Candidatus Woesearchaeota archaeon]
MKFFNFFSRKQKKDVSGLEGFIQQIYWAESLTDDQSKTNIQESLIELTYQGQHYANGLLITNNGYFLTNAHCLPDDVLPNIKIRMHDERTYAIQDWCIRSRKREDLALAKADLPGDNKPRSYKFHIEKSRTPTVILLTRRNGKILYKLGSIPGSKSLVKIADDPSALYSMHLDLKIDNIPGDSGGVITTTDLRIIGLLSSGNTQDFASAATLQNALNLVQAYINTAKNAGNQR